MRLSQLLAACGAATMLVAGALTPAVADVRPISGNDANLNPASIDKSKPIQLLLKKQGTNPYDQVPAGQKPPAIAGAKFTLSKVRGIDITTQQGSNVAKKTTLDDARTRGLDVIETKATNQRGEVLFDNLTPGLYLVEESAPDTKYEYHLSSPKLLILPLPDERGIRYEYENVLVMKWDKSYGTPPPWEPSEPPSTTPTKPGTTVTTTKTTTSTPPRVSTTISTTYTTTPPGGTPTTVTTTVPSTIVTTKPNGVVTTVTHPRAVPEKERGSLASTGANVLWAAGLGGLLIVLGLFLARRSKNETR
ncbi:MULTISPECIES: SpaA isopeptide-forming pilin-related protein [Corynebacterium]|uniref:LPXTG cell wall anchor domain-containing protein n=1 Tax=Corynebacterium lipophilum TaxID=2804918 RepID=A0AAW5HTB1_9CORY|nr:MULTISPECIES: SpaA isopeptide-forming pilin-related protein [Corynebacterium]MCO6394645.1 LPXTG cell wall anchor domain-containing protein [Corynebacterium lipophilum]MCZ2117217.1 SpaA isopeptide-forming pilin-related protein [Corynebacterium lipophilum]